jgi:sulfoxide reductase heme-binding subunit YedZ
VITIELTINKKTLIAVITGIIVTIMFVGLSFSVKTTEAIWVQARIFGLLSFLTLFITVLLGEIRLLHKVKGDFVLFKFHKPIAIFAAFLILLHFISAAFDRFKWGVNLKFVQYLGFTFASKWLILLSMGTLAFYLILLVAFTSASKSTQFLGFKKWKVVHFLSYVSFIIAFIHSINLGTDLKTSALAPILHPMILVMFFGVTALLLVRMLNSARLFTDQKEVALAAVFFLILMIGSVFFVSSIMHKDSKVEQLSQQASILDSGMKAQEEIINNSTQQVQMLQQELQVIKNGQIS